MRTVPVTTYSLEMLSRDAFRPKYSELPGLRVEPVESPCPDFNRFLYCAVGWEWSWVDKLAWTYDQWNAYVDRRELETWVGYLRGNPIGYFELEQQSGGNVEIAYFGVFPQFTGRGLGGHLLSATIERAWDWNGKGKTRRVWVHTCTLDHPAALSNYLARGFRQFKEETSVKTLTDTPCRDWP